MKWFRVDGSFAHDESFGVAKEQIHVIVRDLIATVNQSGCLNEINKAVLEAVENYDIREEWDTGIALDLVSGSESEEENNGMEA